MSAQNTFDLELCIQMREQENRTWHEISQHFGGVDSENAIRKRYARMKKRRDMSDDQGIIAALADVGIDDSLKVKGGWLKTEKASIRFETPNESHDDSKFDDYVAMLKKGLSKLPKSPEALPPIDASSDLLARYILTDLHGGMSASIAVSGGEYDLDIASQRLSEATRRLAEQSPKTDVALIENLGDAFHANDGKKMTPESGHILDMVRESFAEIAYRVTLAVIDMIEILKTKHRKIKYVGIAGNHDKDQFHWLTISLMMRFRDDPQVEVIWNQRKMFCYVFGRNMIAMAHGDRVNFQRLANQVADVHAEEWGQTKFRYLDTGHVHHDRQDREIGGIYCESHRTLAALDAAAFGFGFTGRQSAKVIINHRERGEISRHTASFN